MSELTIQETEAAYGEKAAGIVRGWHETHDEIARAVESLEGPHADILTDGQRAEAARTQKAERAEAKAEDYRREYRELTEERNEAVRARTRSLREQLFGVQDAPPTSTSRSSSFGRRRCSRPWSGRKAPRHSPLFTEVPGIVILGSSDAGSCIALPRSEGTALLPAGSSPQNRGSKVHKWCTADPWR